MSQSETGSQPPRTDLKKSGGSSGLLVGICLLVVAGGVAAWWMRPATRRQAIAHVPSDSQFVAVVKLRDLTEDIPALKRLMAQIYFRGGVNWKGEYGLGGRDLFDSGVVGARFDGDKLQVVAVTQTKNGVSFDRERAIGKPHAGFDKASDSEPAFYPRAKSDKFIGSVAIPDDGTLVFSTERTAPPKGSAGVNANHAAMAGPLVQAAADSPFWFSLLFDEPVLKMVRGHVAPELDSLSSRGRRVVVRATPKSGSYELNAAVECADDATAKKLADDAKPALLAQLDSVAKDRDNLKPAIDEVKASLAVASKGPIAEATATVSIAAIESGLKDLAAYLKTSIPDASQMFETPDGLMPKPMTQRGGG